MIPDQQVALEQVAKAFSAQRGLVFSGSAGDGAFKATFRLETARGESLAGKVYLPGAVSERAAREVQALAHLSKARHPSLPTFLDLLTFDHQGSQYLISIEEFLGGGSLGGLLATRLLDRDELVGVARQLTSALAVVAAAGLVHRDIKPDNIMFRGNGTAVLVDFGLVRNLGLQSLTQTWLAQGPGTPFFAAPEQLNNEKALIDRRTDQFALGATLGIAGRGTHPYARSADSMDAVVGRVARREPIDEGFRRWAQDNAVAPIAKMVEAWPHGRYRIAAELEGAWAKL